MRDNEIKQHTLIYNRKDGGMNKRANCIEVRSSSGVVLFKVYAYETNLSDLAQMTEPQKRLLFRLLAAKGVEEGKIEDELRKLLNVGDLKDASRSEASRLIERLLEEQGNGGEKS